MISSSYTTLLYCLGSILLLLEFMILVVRGDTGCDSTWMVRDVLVAVTGEGTGNVVGVSSVALDRF